ncbi:MAG TPA: tetratricopeptide repeat protein, partial [Planctomycetota bacterium]|nr:tetratricopeptide repeat protein [Planctomycetota bacterium]
RQDIKRAINFSLKGISICQKLGDLPELGELYRVMASAFYRKGDYAHAVDNYQRALDAFEKLELTEASVGALDELGRVYLERGNYFRAARYLYKSVEIRRRHHDLPGLCHSYDELGRVYLRSGDYLKTIDNLNRSLALRERIGDFPGLNPTLVILGDLYFRLGRYEQALVYFRREVENSQKIGDTRGLVEAFAQLGRVFLELGDLKQAESLSKQVSILATEFKLRSQEADGALLDGTLKALSRDWAGAEKCFKLAAEIHGKLGHRRREVSAHLEIAEVKFSRELFDEALKFASKGQIIAEEVKALDLQVRALTIKGSIHRFLKGGNPEKAREFLYRALELSHGLSDVSALFHLYYSLAKVCHSQREFAEAANYYSKAELILKQVREALSEDRGGRFFEDRRRKVFAEDVARFRKEALGRASGAAVDLREPQAPATGTKDRPVGFADYRDLVARILRTHSDLNHLHFHERILAEVVDLTGADRGFLIRVQNRTYFPTAFHGFGKSPTQHPDFTAASALAEEAVRRGRSVLASGFPGSGDGKGKKEERELPLGSLAQRSVLAVPFMTDERIFGGVYLDKPVVLGQFVPRNQVLLEAFAQHTAVALSNRREFETAIREPLTGFYTPGYFIERLREAYRWFNLHGRSFTLIGCYLPSLEDMLGEGLGELAKSLAQEIEEILPHNAAVSWGSPILYVLLSEADIAVQEDVAGRIRARLQATLGEDVPMEVLPATNRHQNGSEVYFEVRRRLVPETCDRKTLVELRSLLAHDITLREAKKILERQKIESTLRKTGGNMTHAARELGIHRPQLSNLLKKHELKREVFEGDLNGDTDLDRSRSDPSEN